MADDCEHHHLQALEMLFNKDGDRTYIKWKCLECDHVGESYPEPGD